MRKILSTILIALIILPSVVFGVSPDVTVSIPEFGVTVNGVSIDTEHSQYPVISYKNVTYFPMTSDYLAGIGLNLSFSSTDGLKINVKDGIGALQQNFLGASNTLGSTHKAQLAPFQVEVNGKKIDNSNEEYPVLLYKNITYFPMTWRFAVEEFGWTTSWSDTTGFGISVDKSASIETTTTTTNYSNDITEQVILRYEGITITAKSIDYSGTFFGPEIKVLIENDSNQDIMVQIREMSINGIMIDQIFSSDVAAGKKINDSITIMESDLEEADIELFKDIEFKFAISDGDSWETLLESEAINISADVDPTFVQGFDNSGLVILDQNGIKIVAKYIDYEGGFMGPELKLYVENNSNEDVTIQIRDSSINGYMINDIFSCDIIAGKKIYDDITFISSDLEENAITTIEDLELYFVVSELEGWDTIFESDVISLTF